MYQKKTEKAEDMKSSGISLVLVSVIGLVGLVLYAFDLLPFVLNLSNKGMIVTVMGGLFLFFLGMGIHSIRAYQRYRTDGETESRIEKEIMAWCRVHLTLQTIEEGLFGDGEEIEEMEELTEEVMYFHRMEKMKEMISAKYMNLEEGFLEKIIDDIYPDIFDI